MPDYKEEYNRWLQSGVLSEDEIMALRDISLDNLEIESRFFAPLEFGTAGLRGIMGLGIRYMNIHTVRQATQGFAAVIAAQGRSACERGVVICFDCRHSSDTFAREAAQVMAGNGIKVRLFESMRPTPELSFAIREYGAIAGINITASHNPKEYNGYKVYWEDGAQLPTSFAADVAEAISHTDIFKDIAKMDMDEALEKGLIRLIGEETDEKFLKKVIGEVVDPDVLRAAADNLKIVYTPFHGTGYKIVPEALRRLGLKHIICVPEQMVIDGDFPTVKSPNPEDPAGFALAIKLAEKNNADLIIGTDPDADRVGIMAKGAGGGYTLITGNQIGVLLLDYMINAKRRTGTLPENAAVLKTIVTTEMARAVAEANGVAIFDTFTGFKNMAEKIKALENAGSHEVFFSYEESYGYMIGSFVRDKDAVTASALIAEMASYYSLKGLSLFDALDSLYEKYGCFAEQTINLLMPGLDGLSKMSGLMACLRDEPPKSLGGTSVLKIRDYKDGSVKDIKTGSIEKMELSGSNVLYFELEDGTHYIVRPSGTEPKIKLYILARGGNMEDCKIKIDKYSKINLEKEIEYEYLA